MAESFLFSIAEGVIAKLGSALLNEISLALGVKGELQKLETTLKYVQAVLMDAELQQSSSSRHELQVWMGSLRDACYSINAVMEEFEYVALQKRLMRPRGGRLPGTGKVRLFFSSSNPFLFHHRMGHRIKKINEILDKIAADRNKFGLKEGEENNFRQIIPRENPAGTYSSLGKSKVFGRKVEKKNIVNLLLVDDEHQNLDVVPVVGIGGLGKTTLAKMVYNDERLTEHFDLKGWVCVSKDHFNVSSLLKKILEALTTGYPPAGDLINEEQVVCQLRRVLGGKKFLLVLDDVWNEDRVRWVELTSLLVGAKGSKVLVTTRSRLVASVVGTLPTQNLGSIPDKDGLSMFVSWAFKEGEELQYPKLMRIGEEMVSKCKGVPLAIRTLGSLLYSKRDEGEWMSVRDNEIWRIDQKEGDILPALKLSYDLLPSHLKRCFAFLSTYPKDWVILSVDLVSKWIALGFIQPTNGIEVLERVGIDHIQQLFSRSFFEEVTDVGSHLIMSMHDLIHDLALLVAKNEYTTVDAHVSHIDNGIRHLTFRYKDEEELGASVQQHDLSSCLSGLVKVRSVTGQTQIKKPVYECFVDLFISRFKYLEVLDLSYSDRVALPSVIGQLKHLRYLNLGCNKNLQFLPESIGKLLFLQTLILQRCLQLRKLPRGFGNLVNLRTLSLTTQVRFLPSKVFKNLVSLFHFEIWDCSNLEYLFDGDDDNNDGDKWMQRSLINLHKLFVVKCRKLVYLPHGLRYLANLEVLAIQLCEQLDLKSDNDSEEDVIIPDGLKSLRYLEFNRLPKLVALPRWLIQGASNTLNELRLFRCQNMTTFPKCLQALQKVVIEECAQLKTLPEEVNCCGTLKELHIMYCPALIRRCQRDTGEDWGKISSVPEIYLDSDVNLQSVRNNQATGERKWFQSRAFLKFTGQDESDDSEEPDEEL